MANAEVGNYLTRLGIGIDAIRYFTSAPPNDLRFIDFETAAALNIAVSDSGSLPTIPAGNPLTRSASFDCKKAATPDEMAVCNDENLSELDISLAAQLRTGSEICIAHRVEVYQGRPEASACQASLLWF